MWAYWWLILILACASFGAGAAIWLYTATALAQVVAPSGDWLNKEARFNLLSSRLMILGAVLAIVGIALAIGYWAKV